MHSSGPGTTGFLFSWLFLAVAFAQQPQQSPQQPTQHPFQQQPGESTTIRVTSSLVLVDVLSEDPKNGLPVRDFKKEDFRIFDNGSEVPISSFDSGAHYSTRPIILWLAVICNEGGKIGGSREFVGKESYFRPALDHLDKHDTVGVAHWCDNGEAKLDLLPTEDRDLPIRALAETIKPIPFQVGGNSDPVGENMYRKMLRLIIQDAHRRNPQPLPVIVFLDGDHTGQPLWELNKVVDDILETSGMVFGIKDDMVSDGHALSNGEQGAISHYVAEQTGGQYFSASAKGYAAALDMILMQLHFRYELGFIPPRVDGKRHELRVVLTEAAKQKHRGVRLRYRPEYIPGAVPEWAR